MNLKNKFLLSLTCSIAISFLVLASCTKKSSKEANKSSVKNKVVFQCAQKKEINTVFLDDSVSLELSDGRKLMLPHAVSASGVRYANSDESIVFWNKGDTAFLTEDDSVTYRECVVKGEQDFTNLKMFQSSRDSLRFRYPKSLTIYHKEVDDTTGWSYASNTKGQLVVQLKSKDMFQPKTNLSEANFSVGWTKNSKEVEACMDLPEGFISRSDTIRQDGVTYRRARYSDAGAGNYYETIQYRTLRNGRCYSLEEMVHSTNIHNYPKERDISEFDSSKVWKALEIPATTFSFTDE